MNNKLGILFILILVGLKFVVQPWFEWVSLTVDDVNQKEKSYYKLSELDKKQDFALDEITRLEKELAPFDAKRLPASRSKITTVTFDYIQELAKKSEVKIVNQRLGEIQSGTLPYIPLELFIEGTPGGLTAFFGRLEQGQYIMVMAETTIVNTTRLPGKLAVNLTMYLALKEAE